MGFPWIGERKTSVGEVVLGTADHPGSKRSLCRVAALRCGNTARRDDTTPTGASLIGDAEERIRSGEIGGFRAGVLKFESRPQRSLQLLSMRLPDTSELVSVRKFPSTNPGRLSHG